MRWAIPTWAFCAAGTDGSTRRVVDWLGCVVTTDADAVGRLGSVGDFTRADTACATTGAMVGDSDAGAGAGDALPETATRLVDSWTATGLVDTWTGEEFPYTGEVPIDTGDEPVTGLVPVGTEPDAELFDHGAQMRTITPTAASGMAILAQVGRRVYHSNTTSLLYWGSNTYCLVPSGLVFTTR